MILEARELRFSYGSLPVLQGVDIRIGPGITAIIGPNAAGKSTLLKCLAGLLRPHGDLRLDQRKLESIPREEFTRVVSYLPQDFSTRAVLTVFETVLLGRLHRLGWHVQHEDVQAVEALLEELGLADLSERNIGELSGGQRQMVTIAQALAREPTVLLMDEPTSSLDLRHQFEVCALVRAVTAARGISAAVAMHDLNMAARFADTIYILENGRVRSSGPPAEVLTEEAIASVYRVASKVSADEHGRPLVIPVGLAQP